MDANKDRLCPTLGATIIKVIYEQFQNKLCGRFELEKIDGYEEIMSAFMFDFFLILRKLEISHRAPRRMSFAAKKLCGR